MSCKNLTSRNDIEQGFLPGGISHKNFKIFYLKCIKPTSNRTKNLQEVQKSE